MGNLYTTDQIISDVQLYGHVPLGNNTFTGPIILRLADYELKLPITKQILSSRGGYYLDYTDYASAPDGLYVIPSDAISGALANVELVQGTTIIQVNEIEESEQYCTSSPTSTSYGYFMKGNYVQILPVPPIGNTRLWFFRRTSQLIPTSSACNITAIAGPVISVAAIPSNIIVGSSLDALADQPPFNILSSSNIVTAIAGTNITLTSAVTNLNIGDWLALHNQTPVAQIPVEFNLLLAQRTVCKIYELQGYLEKLKAARGLLKEYEQDCFGLITPRVKSQTKIINPVNGGFFGGSRRMVNFPAGKNS